MNKEFEKLFWGWMNSFGISAFGCGDPATKEPYAKLRDWCKENKEESLKCIKEVLEDEPNDIVMVLNELWAEELGLKFEGFIPLDKVCNLWLNILNKYPGLSKGQLKDYYKDYRKWKEHLDKNYLPWRPNLEDDPNVTQEEFKQGKRNNKKNMEHKWHDFPLSILKDDELERLYKDGHIGDMTKYIQELHFFYNQVEEEIKRRKLNKK